MEVVAEHSFRLNYYHQLKMHMNNKILFVTGGVIGGLLLGLLFAGAVFPEVRSGNIGMMGNIDRHFIEQMIQHHDGAVAMATLALTKATRPEIKTLAATIVKDQNKEIGDMRNWYKNWFQTEVPKGDHSMMEGGMMSGSGMHMGGQEEVRTLENANDFDKAFIEAMIPHHQLAVMMAQMLRSGTSRPEMLSLADAIIESQSKEIQDMQSWYKSWYK